MIDLERIVEEAESLAPFPVCTVRLIQLVATPWVNVGDIVEVISYDEALTLKLLRAANCAANAEAARVTTVLEAVNRLGMSQMMALAVAAGARPLLQKQIAAYGLNEGALWKHSVAAAVAAETARKFCTVEPPLEVFTSALLHDVGKLVMGRYLSPPILQYIALVRQMDHLSQADAESRILSMNHGELGGIIAQHWQLPARVVQGIIYHHNPKQGADPICDFTYLANEIAKWIEPGDEGRTIDFECLPDVVERLGIAANELENLCDAAASRFKIISERYDAV